MRSCESSPSIRRRTSCRPSSSVPSVASVSERLLVSHYAKNDMTHRLVNRQDLPMCIQTTCVRSSFNGRLCHEGLEITNAFARQPIAGRLTPCGSRMPSSGAVSGTGVCRRSHTLRCRGPVSGAASGSVPAASLWNTEEGWPTVVAAASGSGAASPFAVAADSARIRRAEPLSIACSCRGPSDTSRGGGAYRCLRLVRLPSCIVHTGHVSVWLFLGLLCASCKTEQLIRNSDGIQ